VVRDRDEIEDSSDDEVRPLPPSWGQSPQPPPRQRQPPPPPPPQQQQQQPPPPPQPQPPPQQQQQWGEAEASQSLARLFPHFRSIASLRATGEPVGIDFLGQFDERGGAMAGGRARSDAVGEGAPSRPRGKGRGRDRWTTTGGQKVYIDAQGKRNTGARAYRKYTTAKAKGPAKAKPKKA